MNIVRPPIFVWHSPCRSYLPFTFIAAGTCRRILPSRRTEISPSMASESKLRGHNCHVHHQASLLLTVTTSIRPAQDMHHQHYKESIYAYHSSYTPKQFVSIHFWYVPQLGHAWLVFSTRSLTQSPSIQHIYSLPAVYNMSIRQQRNTKPYWPNCLESSAWISRSRHTTPQQMEGNERTFLFKVPFRCSF